MGSRLRERITSTNKNLFFCSIETITNTGTVIIDMLNEHVGANDSTITNKEQWECRTTGGKNTLEVLDEILNSSAI